MLAYRFMDMNEDGSYLLDGIHPVRRDKKEVEDKINVRIGDTNVDYGCWFIEKEDSLAMFSTFGRFIGVFEIKEPFKENDTHPDIAWSNYFRLTGIIPPDDMPDKISQVLHEITSKTQLNQKSFGPREYAGLGHVDDIMEARDLGRHLAQLGDDDDAFPRIKKQVLAITMEKTTTNFEAVYLYEYAKHNSLYKQIALNFIDLVEKEKHKGTAIYNGLCGLGQEVLDGAIASTCAFMIWNWAFYTAGVEISKPAYDLFKLSILPFGFIGGTSFGLFAMGGDPESDTWMEDSEQEVLELLTKQSVGMAFAAAIDIDSRVLAGMLSGNYVRILPELAQFGIRMNMVKEALVANARRLKELEKEGE